MKFEEFKVVLFMMRLKFGCNSLVVLFWMIQTMKEIKRKNGSAQLKGFEVDLSSFQSILRFRDSLQQWLSDSQMHCSIQLLINNAGILATSSRLTSEGFDQ